MTIIQHIRRQVRILREGIGRHVPIEVVKTLDLGETCSIERNALVGDKWAERESANPL